MIGHLRRFAERYFLLMRHSGIASEIQAAAMTRLKLITSRDDDMLDSGAPGFTQPPGGANGAVEIARMIEHGQNRGTGESKVWKTTNDL
jgi:hypothetical protein